MTKKEIQATMLLISSVRCTISEIESYCRDFDSTILKSTASELKEALAKFRKEAKI